MPKKITAANSKSTGVTSEFVNWKTGDMITCLSKGEEMFAHILLWNDDVATVESQYELDNQLLNTVIQKLTNNDPNFVPDPLSDAGNIWTADFYCVMRNEVKWAFQVKANRESIQNMRDLRRIYIESMYWQYLGVHFNVIYKEDIDRIYYENIKRCVRYYDEQKTHDEVSRYQHLVAKREIIIDMHKPIDWKKQAAAYFEGKS